MKFAPLLALCVGASADVGAKFAVFMEQHGKAYASKEEHAKRLEIFSANIKRIEGLNALSKTAEFRMNKFGDLHPDEFRASHLSATPAVRDDALRVAPDIDTKDLPQAFDWRTKGAVTPVKNQGGCGSCWAFSAVGNIEGQHFLAGHNLTQFSEQNLVDCDHECMVYDGSKSCDAGCGGGLQPNAFRYVIKTGGIDTEESYPYQGVDGQCQWKKANVGATISNYTMISKEADQIAAQLVARGPLAIAADAAEWQFYFGGIFDIPCGTSLDHGILIVGYGSGTNIWGVQDYWWIKNSWGADWGESGYLRVHKGSGTCGVNLFVSTAEIDVYK
jgi:cathepsin F